MKINHCIICKKIICYKAKRCKSCAAKKELNPNWNNGSSYHYCIDCNRSIKGYYAKRCRKCFEKKLSRLYKGKIVENFIRKRNGQNVNCSYCNKKIYRTLSMLDGVKNNFCSHRCHTEYLKGKKLSRVHCLNIGKAHAKLWQNPKYAKMRMQQVNKRPNKSESKLYNLFNEILPNEYKYVGNGEFILAGKCPDFLNINGQKKIVELWGDYWHRGQNPQNRIDLFKEYGYDTLVIWERELKDFNNLKNKIIKFNET